jgi:hypothetical protein
MGATLLERRRQAAGELDHERLWLAVGGSAVLAGAVGVRWGLRPPPCLFHLATGFPCPGCGSTRAMLQLLQGHVTAALAFNPLMTLLAGAGVIWALYASAVLALRLPRLRVGPLSRRGAMALRSGVIAAVLANWWWVIAHHL